MRRTLNTLERRLSIVQGRLFERSLAMSLDSVDFIEKFMNSETCAFYDLPYDRLQWAGEEYIMENLLEEIAVQPAGDRFGKEELFWTGYVYRCWRFLAREDSREIYAQAEAWLMRDCYPGFHTLDVAMAIENLKILHLESNQHEKRNF